MNFYRDVHHRGVVVIGAHNSVRPRCESVHGFWTTKDDVAVVLKLLSKGLLKVRDLITLKIGFQKAEEAYDKLIRSKSSVLGVILDWTTAQG